MTNRRIALFVLFLTATLWVCLAWAQTSNSGDALIGFLNQSIEWCRRVELPGQLSTDPADSVYTAYNRNASVQAISLIFDYARRAGPANSTRTCAGSSPAADNNPATHNLRNLSPARSRR